MTIKLRLLSTGAALLLSAGAAAAMPATAQTELNVRSGPGTQYPVVGSIAAGEAVDAGSCTGSWCQVSFSGGSGYANRGYLALAGAVAPGVGVAVAPDDAYDNAYTYDDTYYDYDYGPGFGVFVGPRFRHHHGWNGRLGWNGNGVGTSQGTWQRRGFGGNRFIATPGSVSQGFNRGASFNRGAPQVSAPVGLRTGAGIPGGGAIRGGAGGPPAAGIGGGGHRR
jgi:uncharacterized protein YraI